MRLKDVIALGILSLLSFPLVLLGILLGMGKIHMSFGDTPLSPEAKARLAEHAEAPLHPVAAPAAPAGAKEGQVAELDQRESQIQEEQKRLEGLQQDVARGRDSLQRELDRLAKEHQDLEQLLGRRDSVDAVRVKALAATLAAMKPDDAAKILVGLDNSMATNVLRAISEVRSRGKILAAIGHLSQERAALLAKFLGSAKENPSKGAAAKGRSAPGKAEKPK